MEQSRYLPEGIIHRILRFLGATDQARVCVLSKDWLHAWQTYPAPTFSDQPLRCLFQQALGRGDEECEKYCRQGRLKFQDHVKRTLLNYKGEHIQELTLDIYHIGDEDSAATLDKLLEIAMEKGVKQLKLLIHRYHCIKDSAEYYYVLPISILRAQSLTDLEIKRCRFPACNQLFNGGKFLVFNNIKSLSLACVYIEDEKFQLLLSACPLIHNLDVKLCEGLTRIKVVNLPRLKKLDMRHEIRKSLIFAVDAPSLESLSISYFGRTWRVLQLPASQNLRELVLLNTYITNTFFNDWPSIFPRLEILELHHCHVFQNINLISHSLKHIRFSFAAESLVELDAPNIIDMKISVSAETMQKVSFKGALPRQCVSDLCIIPCYWSSIDVSWFMKLNELLSNLNPSKISLRICCASPLSEHASFEGIPTFDAHPVDIEHLDLTESRADLPRYLTFLDGLFWACHPKHFVLHWLTPLAYLPVKIFFYKKFITDQRNRVFSNWTHTLSFWQHYLKKTEIHFYDTTGKKCGQQDYLHWQKVSKIILHLDWSASSNLWNAKITEPLKRKSSSVKNSGYSG